MQYAILWASVLLLFGGCTVPRYTPSDGKLITVKTDSLRFHDIGYIRRSNSGVEVELFSAGQLVEKFVIEKQICTRQGCLDSSDFYRKFLHVNYPKETLKHVFRGEPIFNKRDLEQSATGFKQVIQTDEYNIVYKVNGENIYFKDRANAVLIKIREFE